MPSSTPAPNAAVMPIKDFPGVSEWLAVATARIAAPPTIAKAPPSTFDHPLNPEPRSSLKSNHPQNKPTRLFVFHSGNAIARPTSRTAKMVSVLATAHSVPASSAHTIRCGLSRRSWKRNPVPFSRVGTVQRATKAPMTIPIEMMKGEKPALTNLVGASALPSHTAAANPQNTPSLCRERVDRPGAPFRLSLTRSPQSHEKGSSQNQNANRYPKVNIGENAHQRRSLQALTSSRRTGRCSS